MYRSSKLGLKVFLLLSVATMFFLSASAQKSNIDLLLNQLERAIQDTAKITILKKLSIAYTTVDADKKLNYAKNYLALAEKHSIDTSVVDALNDIAVAFSTKSVLDSGMHYFKRSLDKAKAADYTRGIGRAYVNIGFIYDRMDKKQESIKNYEQSLTIFKKINHKKGVRQCIINIASLYFDLAEYKIAEEYALQALAIAEENPEDKSDLAKAYFLMGGVNRRLQKLNSGLAYYQKSLKIREEIGDLNGIALSKWGIGLIFAEQKKYVQALSNYEQALKYNQQIKNLYQEVLVQTSMAYAYKDLEKFELAEKLANDALDKARKSGTNSLKKHVLQCLEAITTAQNKFKEALDFKVKSLEIAKSIDTFNITNRVIADDLRRVNSDNRQLQTEKSIITSKIKRYANTVQIVSTLLILFSALCLIFYIRNKERKKTNQLLENYTDELSNLNEELSTQMEIVSAQNIELEKLNALKNKLFSLISHDLKSPLNNLKNLFELYRKGDLEKQDVDDLLGRLENSIYNVNDFLVNLLEWSKSQLDGINAKPSLFSLIDVIDKNIKLYSNQIQSKNISITNTVGPQHLAYADVDMIDIVVRNLLSNAVKFCEPGRAIAFEAKIIEDKLQWLISDNGPGINEVDKANLFNLAHAAQKGSLGEKGHHLGLILCKEMIERNLGTFDFCSEVNKGTTFIITLPIAATGTQRT
jgi:two-component system sensor histidine kinase/response regulator